VTRRSWIAALLPALSVFAAAPGLSLRGKLLQRDGQPPSLETSGKSTALHGDGPTLGVLNDKRLAGVDLEALGQFTNPDLFEVDPIHLRAMFVHKDGKKLLITYWCDVCYIRTYTPGVCWCCQKYTDLDLRESGEL
jgi:hypothetical protein